MKVLVMSDEQASSRIQGYKDTLEMEIALGTYDAEEIGAMKFRLAAVQSFRASMTVIDIPEGCKLAVVGPLGGTVCPVCNGLGRIVADKSMYFNSSAPVECLCCQGTGRWDANHRRVVQEVM